MYRENMSTPQEIIEVPTQVNQEHETHVETKNAFMKKLSQHKAQVALVVGAIFLTACGEVQANPEIVPQVTYEIPLSEDEWEEVNPLGPSEQQLEQESGSSTPPLPEDSNYTAPAENESPQTEDTTYEQAVNAQAEQVVPPLATVEALIAEQESFHKESDEPAQIEDEGNLYLNLGALISSEIAQPTGISCGPSSVANALNLYFNSEGYWISNYNKEIVEKVFRDGTSLETLNALTNASLGEELKDDYYTLQEMDQMLETIGLEAQNMGFRSTEGVQNVLAAVGSFNDEEHIGAFTIAHFSHHLNQTEGDHFAVVIPEMDAQNLTLNFIDSYGPSIDNLEQYAIEHNIPYNVQTNEHGQKLGISIDLGYLNSITAINFLTDSNLNNIQAIPVLGTDLRQGTPTNLRILNNLSQQPTH